MTTPDPHPDRHPDRHNAEPLSRRLVVPSLISVLVHAGLLAVVATVTWTIVVASAPDPPGGEVLIDFDHPASEPIADDEPTDPAPTSLATAPVPPAPPELDALSRLTPPRTPALPTLTRRAGTTTSPALTPSARPRRGIAFAGVRADRAASVVYVLDASGAMASSLPFAVEELSRSIGRLAPSQRFQVVIFRDRSAVDPAADAPAEAFAPDNRWTGLLTASPVHKAAARQWLNKLFPSGRSRPLAGIEMALSLHPDVVFVLTRSIQRTQRNAWGAGEQTILDRLDRLNPVDRRTGRRSTLIKAIQLIDDDPTGILQAIGRVHGGTDGYVVRSLDQLGRLADAPAPVLQIDPRLDQAAALLAALAKDSTDLRVLYAIPTDRDRSRAARDAIRASELLGELAPDDDASALLEARADLIANAAQPDPALLDRAALLLARTDPDEPAMRWIHQLLASNLDAARANPARTLRLPPMGDPPRGIDADLVFESRLALLMVVEIDQLETALDALLGDLADPPFAIVSGIDPALAQLAIDTASRRFIRAAPADAPARMLTRAINAQLRWLDLDGADLSPDDRRSLALGRLASLVPPDAPLADLPPIATLARALAFAASPDGRPDAIDLLRELSARDDAGELAPRALDTMAALLATSPALLDRLHSVVILEELADDHPGDPAGEQAQLRALALARQIESEMQGDPKHKGVQMAYIRTLEHALQAADLPHRDYWLAEHDRVCLALARAHHSVTSLHLLAKVRPASPQAPAALELYDSCLQPELTDLTNAYRVLRDEPAQADRAADALAAARGLLANAQRFYESHHQLRRVQAIRAQLADLLVLARDPQAQAIYHELILDRAIVPSGSRRLSIGLAESLITQGRDAAAVARLRQIVADPDLPPSSEHFWRAWTLLLEAIARHNDDHARDATLRARIAWLRNRDPALGPEPWRTRLTTIAQQLGTNP